MSDDPIKQRIMEAIRKDELEKAEIISAEERVKIAHENLREAEKALEEYHSRGMMWGRETNFGRLIDELQTSALGELEMEKKANPRRGANNVKSIETELEDTQDNPRNVISGPGAQKIKGDQ